MKKKQNRKGFTLTELLVVVAVIGILAGIAVPAYMGQQKRAKKTEAKTNLQAIRLLMEEYYADNGTYGPPGVGLAAPFNAAYRENDAGGVLDDSIISAGGGYLRGFKPKGSAGRQVVLYDYLVVSPSVPPCLPPPPATPANLTYCITATPVLDARSAPNHAPMFIDQDGAKGPDGVW